MISEVSPGSEFLAVWRRRDLRDPLKVPGKPFHKVGRERGAYKGSNCSTVLTMGLLVTVSLLTPRATASRSTASPVAILGRAENAWSGQLHRPVANTVHGAVAQ